MSCKYCTDKNGRGNKFGMETCDDVLCDNSKIELRIEIFEGAILDITAWYGKNDYIEDTIKINYCPFCGRKLKEV